MTEDIRDRLAELEQTVEDLLEAQASASQLKFIPVQMWRGFADTLEVGENTEVSVIATVYDPTDPGLMKWLVSYDDEYDAFTAVVDQVGLKPITDDRRDVYVPVKPYIKPMRMPTLGK